MKTSALTLVVAVLALMFLADPAEAQRRRIGRSYRSRPTTSPYLNLLRNNQGGGIGFNYFQRVRPEREFRDANRRFRRSVDSLGRRLDVQKRRRENLKSGLTQTGHAPRFGDLRGYFGRR